jgi:hypothetical protein
VSDAAVGFDVETLPPDVKELVRGGRVFKALGADPKFRPRMLEIIKEASPETPIPELDLQRDMDARVAGRVKPIEDEAAALRAEVAELRARNAREDLRAKHGLDESEFEEVQALTKDGKITDTETAIEHHRMRMALSAPRPTVEPGAEQFQQKLRKINPRNVNALKQAAMDEGSRVLREMRGRRFA